MKHTLLVAAALLVAATTATAAVRTRDVEYSQDGQRWHGVFPVDGIADSKSERYELSIDGDIGERGVTLRASDAMNNVASAQVDRPLRP